MDLAKYVAVYVVHVLILQPINVSLALLALYIIILSHITAPLLANHLTILPLILLLYNVCLANYHVNHVQHTPINVFNAILVTIYSTLYASLHVLQVTTKIVLIMYVCNANHYVQHATLTNV